MAPLLRGSAFTLLALFFLPSQVPVGAEGNWPWLQRHKRDWVTVPRSLEENQDYSGLEYIAWIRSDKDYNREIFYYLSGPGVDLPPIGLFSINHNNGKVRIHSDKLDREERSSYLLKGLAKFRDGTFAEKDIDLKIVVTDLNDNAPVVVAEQVGFVNESSAAGTLVMRVIVTDADQEGTPHTQIFYSIDEQSNREGMFFINSDTGEIRVKQNTLDRETKDSYRLTVVASDMNGQAGGNTGSGEVVIQLGDINDNIPVLEKETYVGSVEENVVNMEVMRIKAIDMDMIHTENWQAVYEIVTGNEAGFFTITTDRKTNEGIIMVQKPLDYEQIKALKMGVVVYNKAKYNFGSSHTGGTIVHRPYPVTINVVNQKEGPRFQPSVKVVTISEDMTLESIKKVITTYAAIDSDTLKTATNVRYAKFKDEDNWLFIDENTADIRLNKLPDRESKFLKNGTYYAEVICISNDTPSKTATGTIAIQVDDVNDHCPKLTATTQTMCLNDKIIYVTAVDEDEHPNSAPFEFTVIDGSGKGKWTVEPLNDTSVILRDQANLWPGIYQVRLEVKDQQGLSCGDVQVVDVTVCSCLESTKACVARSTSTTGLGVGGILLLLLGLLLLLLVPLLLLFCLCGGAAGRDFKPIPFDTKQQLISYHTEGQGDDKEVPLLHIPVEVDGGFTTKDINDFRSKGQFDGLTKLGGGGGFGNVVNVSTLTEEELHRYNLYRMLLAEQEGMKGAQEHHFSQFSGGIFNGMALSEQFLGEYYSRKSNHAAEQSEQKDALLVYDYEGQESLAGSIGCCSLLENENDLAFLNDLGPKFKTLAEICHGSAIVTEVDAGVNISPNRPLSPVRPSINTHVHTHSERIRDRDSVNVNVNTFDTSNVASGSSTIVKEERFTERSHGSATLPKVHVQDKILIPNQTMFVQQPTMYYAATPMYVVEPQSNVLFMGAAQQQAVGQIGHVGLGQGLVQVGGLQGSQGMVLVDRHVGVDGVTGMAAQGLSQGSVSRSRKVVVVENGSSGVEQGGHLAQGFVRTAKGSAGQVFEVRGPSLSVSSSGPTESTEGFSVTTAPRLQGSQKKTVVQRKKVSVTERTVDSNTRA